MQQQQLQQQQQQAQNSKEHEEQPGKSNLFLGKLDRPTDQLTFLPTYTDGRTNQI